MSPTAAQAARLQDPPDAADAAENESPNRTKAALRSVMKTATKALRVPADIEEGSPTPVRVLRNGKKIRATPRLPKASRVTVSPEDAKALGGAHRVPLAQVQQQPVTPPTQPATLSEETPPVPSHNQKISGATPEAGLSQRAPSTPSALISSLQQLQLAGSTPESSLLCQELLADGSSENLQTPESRLEPGVSSVAPPLPAEAKSTAPTAADSHNLEHDSDSAPGEHTLESPAPAAKPEAGSQAVASASTPQHQADSAAGGVVTEAPAPAAPSCESSGHAAAHVCTPEHGSNAGSAGPAVETLTPAAAAPHAEESAASASAETPLPMPSPQLTGQPDLITPPPQALDDAETPGTDAPHHMQQDTPDEALACALDQKVTDEEDTTAEVSSYLPRDKRTPFMERKLRALQAKEWADQDVEKVHRSRLEREKEAAAAARKDSLSSADKAATRRLVQGTFARAVNTQGKDLAETMVKHKSRLEREKEAAAGRKAGGLPGSPGQAGQARQRRSPAGSSFAGQGLGDMKTHMSRLEKERAAAATKKAAGVSSPAVESRLPSYMRQTAASAAMQKEGALGENLKVHRSQLERDRDQALALQAARKKAGHNPLTPYPAKRQSAAKPRLSFGSLIGGPPHKSKLEKAKEAATAASAAAQAGAATSRPPKPATSFRAATAPGAGLGDMKPHKSRLEREKEAWARQASAEGAAKPTGAVLQVVKPNTNPPVPAKKSGSKEGEGRKEGFSDFVPN